MPTLLRCLLLAIVLLPLAVSAQTTYTVTKADDTADGVCDADCSLREAVAASNATPSTLFSPDTIRFAPALTGATIAFAPGQDALVTSDSW